MDVNRVAGSIKDVEGATKEATGQAIGDAKFQIDGDADKAGGKIQHASGGLTEAVRDAEAMKSAGLLLTSSIKRDAGL
jgi:uncharacterized protein YjbJ (UPF0337 family)